MSQEVHNTTVAVATTSSIELTASARDASAEVLGNEPRTMEVLLDRVIEEGMPTCEDAAAYRKFYSPVVWFRDCFLSRVRNRLLGSK